MVDLLRIIQNIVLLNMPFSIFLYAICFVLGVIFVMGGLGRLARQAEMGSTRAPVSFGGYWGPLYHLITGVLFISMPALIVTLNATIFGVGIQSADRIFEYAPATVGLFTPGSPAREMLTGIIMIIQFLGFVAIMRGVYLLNRAAQGDSGPTFGPGVTFMVAGIMAMNFPVFVGAVEQLVS